MPDERTVIYALCDDHPHDEETADAVENALSQQGVPGCH